MKPLLVYADIIYDKPVNESFIEKYEAIQYNVSLIVSGAIRGTSQEVAKFGSYRSCRNGDINFYMISYMGILEIDTAQICHIARLLKSGTPIYNSKVPNTAGRKERRKRRRIQAITKRYAFHVIAKKQWVKTGAVIESHYRKKRCS